MDEDVLLGMITDKQGQCQEVLGTGDADWYQLIIWGDDGRIAYVNLSWQHPPVMQLADIKIEEAYRNRGIGIGLMRLTMDVARQQHLTRVEGLVTTDDLAETLHLLDWYRKQAFTVDESQRYIATQHGSLRRTTTAGRCVTELRASRGD